LNINKIGRFGATPFGLRPHTQDSPFRVERSHTARIKVIKTKVNAR